MRLTIIMSVVLVAVTLTPSAGETEDVLSIGQRFHYETSYGDSGARAKNPLWGKQVPLYKEYPDVAKIQLPEPGITDASLETVVSQRKSIRSFADKSLTVEQLSRLLVTADGLTHTSGSWQMRSAPSGGALYPIDIYVIVSSVESLAKGLYHFQVSDSSLELVRKGDFAETVHVASNEQTAVGSSPITIIVTARFDRSTAKYSDRGYRYTYMEAGCICQNIYLQATALQLGTVAVGAFNDDSLNGFLDVDGQSEAALLMMPVGFPAGD
jgi:SagB-type dehydrogenase family enzyme